MREYLPVILTVVCILSMPPFVVHGRRGSAGFYSPYPLTPGGGEYYFLMSLKVLQSLSYDVELIVDNDNPCNSMQCISKTLDALRIHLQPFRLSILNDTHRHSNNVLFDFFYSMGNTKYPGQQSLGAFNVYMCQFPFDYHKEYAPEYSIIAWSGYDLVLVNSAFTYNCYVQYVQKAITKLEVNQVEKYFPSVQILHPPVTPFDVRRAHTRQASKQPKVHHISLIGRFFHGRHNKGHAHALNIFGYLVNRLPKKSLHLNLIGYVYPDQKSQEYLERLQHTVKLRKLSVSFHTNCPPEEITTILSKTAIYWHLTGVNMLKLNQSYDLASVEHFGISIVEAMAAGCIPIVVNRGGVLDIVHHGNNGFVANSEEEFEMYSMKILTQISFGEIERMKAVIRHTVAEFSAERFSANFISALWKEQRAQEISLRFNHTIFERASNTAATGQHSKLSSTARSASASVGSSHTRRVAVLIEPSMSARLRACVLHTLRVLGGGWSVHIYHSEHSHEFLRHELAGIPAEFILLSHHHHFRRDQHRLLKSPSFWERYSRSNVDQVLHFSLETLLLQGQHLQSFGRYDRVDFFSGGGDDDGGGIKGSLVASGTGTGSGTRSTVRTRDRGGTLQPLSLDIPKQQRGQNPELFFSTEMATAVAAIQSLRSISLPFPGVSLSRPKAMLDTARAYNNQSNDMETDNAFFNKYATKLGYKVADNDVRARFGWALDPPKNVSLHVKPFALQGSWFAAPGFDYLKSLSTNN